MSNPSQPHFTFTVAAPQPQQSPRRPRFHAALWLIGIGLLANAVVLATRAQVPDIALDRAALAQATPTNGSPAPMLGARGIYMMPAQLGPNSYGLYLMDVDSGTICVYQALPDSQKFRFMASRSFKFDRFMEDYNAEGPRPKVVQGWVEQQRQINDLHQKDNQPTVDQTTKPSENLPDAVPDAAKNGPGN